VTGLTRDNGMQVIRWIGKREMSVERTAAKEQSRPSLDPPGAIGQRCCQSVDMMVCAQHGVLDAPTTKRPSNFEDVSSGGAKHLTDMEGIDVVDRVAPHHLHSTSVDHARR